MNLIKTKLKKGDNVLVISGKEKGKTGSILSIFPKKNRAIVKGVNMAKKLILQKDIAVAGTSSR